MKKTVTKTTLKHDLCINCGICKTVCPKGAIELKPNWCGEFIPKINKKKCTNCGLCKNYCPNTKQKFKDEANKISAIPKAQTYGLWMAKYYVAWSKDKAQRQKCCSGGVVTEIAKYLFNNNLIDGMIHTERLWANRGELHYGARLSKSIDEITKNVSSTYQPIDFSEILLNLEENKTYFMTGTPCVIRGIKKLFSEHKKFRKIKIITCALICSHNTNSQFIDFLTQMNGLEDNEKWQVNIRQKDDSIIDANNFQNHIYTKTKDLLKKNRFESGWTDIWRSYYFAMNACLYCSDFWGYEADISIKDAWGEWASDPLGKSIVVIRNNELDEILKRCNVIYESLDYEVIKNHQYSTPEFKQIQAYNKNFKCILSKSNRRNRLLSYKIISKSSKILYKFFGYKFTKKAMDAIVKLAFKLEKL